MIETYIDFATCDDLRVATDRANECIKIAEDAGWNMIQCQLIQAKDNADDVMSTYSLVFQRTKEVKARQQFEFGGEHAFKEQSTGEIPLGDES